MKNGRHKKTIRWVFVGLTLFWLSGAFFGDPVERQARFEYNGYTILEGDFHTHSFLAGAFPLPWEIVAMARYQNLDIVGLTEHNSIMGAHMGQVFAEWFYPELIVFPGEELTTRTHHILLLGLEDYVSAAKSPLEAAREAKEQGAFVLVAHPVKKFWPKYDEIRYIMDGAEVLSPSAYRAAYYPEKESGEESWSNRRSWRWQDMKEYFDRVNKMRAGEGIAPLAPFANSDYHGLAFLGVARTIVFTRDTSRAGILAALKNRQTVAYISPDLNYGEPVYKQMLADSGYKVKGGHYKYEASALQIMLTAAFFIVLIVLYFNPFRQRMHNGSQQQTGSPIQRS